VGRLLTAHAERFDETVAQRIQRLAEASEWLRGERELSFYGDVDFIPTEEYTAKEGRRAIAEAKFAAETARMVIKNSGRK
jgi:hypothetical protein